MAFDVFLEMLVVFVACRCKPCAILAAMKSSGMGRVDVFLYNRDKCFSTLLVKILIVSALTPFRLQHFLFRVDDVVFLQRERCHRVLWLVAAIFVFVCLRRRRAELFVNFSEHFCFCATLVSSVFSRRSC